MAYHGKLEWLQKIRTEKGWSQHRTAAEAGISQSLYAYIELGYKPPSPEQAAAIGKVLGFEASRFSEEEARRAAV